MNRESAASPLQSLREIAVGGRAKVAGFDLPEANRHRLLEMGFTPGTVLEVIRYAPLGDPVEVRVRGYHVSLRRADAKGILVVGMESR